MSSFEVKIVIDRDVLACCKCCCCCPIGSCNWMDTGGSSEPPPPTASATITHPSAYAARFDIDNAHNNPFPMSPIPEFQLAPYSCEGSQTLTVVGNSERGFKKNGSGLILLKFRGNVEKHEPGYDCGYATLYRCKGPTDTVVGTGGEVVLTFSRCSSGCPPTYDHPASTECYCNMLTIGEDQVIYTEVCDMGTSHYRFECGVDTIDGNWHYGAYWQFSLVGVTLEDCATPMLRTLNKRKIRANLLDRMKKISPAILKKQKERPRFFKPIISTTDRSKVLIKKQDNKWKKIF